MRAKQDGHGAWTCFVHDVPHAASSLNKKAVRHNAIIALQVMPLGLFICAFFVLPILLMLSRSIYDPYIARALPTAVHAIQQWKGTESLPGPRVMQALVHDLRHSSTRDIGRAAERLNFFVPGYLSLLLKTHARAGSLSADPPLAAARKWLIRTDPRWGDVPFWAAIRNHESPLTDGYLLAAVDLTRGTDGDIQPMPPDQRVFREIILRTLKISLVTTLLCLLLAFPLAYAMTSSRSAIRTVLMGFVLLPFWTSLLVRTIAWVVLLQANGPILGFLHYLDPSFPSIQLVHNRFGVYVAMVHILLPFAVLPLYSVMVGIPPNLVRAAFSLGGRPIRTFLRVYLPQAMPGLTASAVLVFTIALGYYITPALVGGARDQLLSYYIAAFVNQTVNWGMAAALSVVLLTLILVLLLLSRRLFRLGTHAIGA